MAINTLNLYNASKEQILQHANYLQQSLAETNTALDKLNPDAQVIYCNSFQKDYALLIRDLNALDVRVTDTYRKAKNAIPNISEDELKIIFNKLETAKAHLGNFSANEALAKKISGLFPTVKAAFADSKNADPEILDNYRNQIVELKSDRDINTGNREAVKELMRIANVPDMNEVSDDAESDFEQKAQELLEKIMDLMNSCDPADKAKVEQIKNILNVKPIPSSRVSQTRSESVEELLNLLSFFKEGANLTDAVQRLEEIEYRGIEFQTILESVYFHLYFIHKIETPRALKNDLNYGKNAMIGVYPATNTDRSRAINRTLAEIAVQALEDTVTSGQISDTQEVLKTLESLEMSAGDMPESQNNLAHALFGKMYHKHLEARKTNSSLIDPHHRLFQGDFGRHAFGTNEVDRNVKIAAIQELHADLKRAWKLVI